jgi:vacuolar protein sorting-associated protein 13A/C
LELLDQLDLSFAVTYLEHIENAKRPDIEVQGSMSDLNLRLTQNQYKFLLELSRTIPGVFSSESVDGQELAKQLPIEPPKAYLSNQEDSFAGGQVVHLNPELGTGPDSWTRLDLVFKVGSIAMELYSCELDKPITDLQEASLSRASLTNTNVKLRMISDGSLESEFLIESFDIRDSRKQETNKFRKIMSSTHKEGSQFMANFTLSGGAERNLVALLTIDSPRVIFALDYIFVLRDYIMSGLPAQEEPHSDLDIEESESEDYSSQSEHSESVAASRKSQPVSVIGLSRRNEKMNQGINLSFRVNIVDAQVILIANPAIANSEAIVLGTKQVLLSQQHALTLQIEKVGMFLCRMDKFEGNRLRILDDFTLKVSVDNRKVATNSHLQSINVEVEPLVLRVSLRDIMLAVQIFNKASEMSDAEQRRVVGGEAPTEIKGLKGTSSLKRRTASGHGVSTKAAKGSKSVVTGRSTGSQKPVQSTSSTVVRREEMKAEVEGMRVILIGDQHELPLLDLSVKRFTTRVRDWTGDVCYCRETLPINTNEIRWTRTRVLRRLQTSITFLRALGNRLSNHGNLASICRRPHRRRSCQSTCTLEK